jgi:hypothetical protein
VGLRKNPSSAAGFYSRILRRLTFRQLVKGSGRSSRQLGDLICQPDDCRLAIFGDGLLDVGATQFHVQWTIGCKGNRRPSRLPWAGAAFLNCLFRTWKRHAKIRKPSIIPETNLRDRAGRASQLLSPQKPPADFTTYFRQRAGFCQRFRPETLMRIRSGIAKGSTSTVARPFRLNPSDSVLCLLRCAFRHSFAASEPVSQGEAQTNEGACVMVAKANKAFGVAWPLTGIGLAVAVNAVWIGALGYGVSKLF